MKIRIKKVPQQVELNARKWKHGDGGHLFLDGGEEENSKPEMSTAEFLDYLKSLGRDIAGMEGEWADTPEDSRAFLIENRFRYDPNSQKVKKFFSDYVNSKNYDRILNNQWEWWQQRHPYRKYITIKNDIIPKKLKLATTQLGNTSNDEAPIFTYDGTVLGSFSVPSLKEVYVGNKDYIEPGILSNSSAIYKSALGHEYAHLLNDNHGIFWGDAMSKGQVEALEYGLRHTPNSYIKNHEEGHSDIWGLRFLLEEEGIYDSRNNIPPTEEQIQKLRDKYPELRILLGLTNKEVVWLLEHVAHNNTLQDFRLQFANQAAFGGPIVKAANKHLYDGESEDTLLVDIANSYPMSLQDYIAQRIQDTKDSAVNVMNTRKTPLVIYSNITGNLRAQQLREEYNKLAQEHIKLIMGSNTPNATLELKKKAEEANAELVKLNNKYNKEISRALAFGDGYIPEGNTCLYTLTDSYGKNRRVAGNLSWIAKQKGLNSPLYALKGFRKLSPEETLQQGDIVLFGAPKHAEMFMDYSSNRKPKETSYPIITTYSNGSYGPEAMKRNADYNWFNPNENNAFRFVGNAADSARWTKEYNELILSGPIVEKALGGHLFDEGGDKESKYTPIIYIGGTPQQAREKYWQEYPRMGEVVDSIANVYGINPILIKNNLNHEGFVDRRIDENNWLLEEGVDYDKRGLVDDFLSGKGNDEYATHGFSEYGFDNGVGAPIIHNEVTLPSHITYDISPEDNELGERVMSISGRTPQDNIEITAIMLKRLSDKIKLDYPNLSEYDHNRYVRAFWNRGIANGKRWVKNGAKGYNYKNGGHLFDGESGDSQLIERMPLYKYIMSKAPAVRNAVLNAVEMIDSNRKLKAALEAQESADIIRRFTPTSDARDSSPTGGSKPIISNELIDEINHYYRPYSYPTEFPTLLNKIDLDLELLGADKDKEQEILKRYHNTPTIEPTNEEARTGWMEVVPGTDDIIYHAPTVKVNNLPGAWEQMAQRAWESPAFLLALAPMFDAPFMLGNIAKERNILRNIRQAFPGNSEELLYRNYIDGYSPEKLLGVNNNIFNSLVTKGVSPRVKDNIMHNVVERNLREYMPAIPIEDLDFAANGYRTFANKLLDDVHVGIYSGDDYAKAGENAAGFYIDDANRPFISVNRNASNTLGPLGIEDHEARHLIDYKGLTISPQQEHILDLAYGDDFINLPNTPQGAGFKDYTLMNKEKVTTNADARNVLLYTEDRKLLNAPIEVQNKYIDNSPDITIFQAVEQSNGYGQAYIEYLRKNNLLTPEKAQAFRESMKHVGGYIPWTIGGIAGYSYLNQEDEGPIVAFANGGNLLGEGGLEQDELSIGNIGFFNHPLLSLKYYGSPLYDLETPFTVAFTDAIIKDKDDFMWNGKMYSTDIDWNKKFEKDANGNIPFQEFANYMYPAVIKILKEKGLPLTNAHNIVRLAGLESLYGTNPVSGKGYNLSGIKWNPKTMGNYNHATNSKDNLEYVDFDNLKDYLEFKIDLLNNRYDAINAESDKDFVDRLHLKSSGINKKGFDYSTNYKGYLNMLLNTKSLDKWLKLLYTPVVTQQGNL